MDTLKSLLSYKTQPKSSTKSSSTARQESIQPSTEQSPPVTRLIVDHTSSEPLRRGDVRIGTIQRSSSLIESYQPRRSSVIPSIDEPLAEHSISEPWSNGSSGHIPAAKQVEGPILWATQSPPTAVPALSPSEDGGGRETSSQMCPELPGSFPSSPDDSPMISDVDTGFDSSFTRPARPRSTSSRTGDTDIAAKRSMVAQELQGRLRGEVELHSGPASEQDQITHDTHKFASQPSSLARAISGGGFADNPCSRGQCNPVEPLPRHSALHASDNHRIQSVSSDYSRVRAARAVDGRAKETVLDMTDTVETEVETFWDMAVVHDAITPSIQHITRELISRDIHHHHVRRYILPIVDVRTLPAKHFAHMGPNGSLIEVTEPSMRAHLDATRSNWIIAETISQSNNEGSGQAELQTILRRLNVPVQRFDREKRIGREGEIRKDTTWIHPPHITGLNQGEIKRSNRTSSQSQPASSQALLGKTSFELDAEVAVTAAAKAQTPQASVKGKERRA